MRLLPSALLCATALTAVPALAQSGVAVAAGGASIATPSASTTIVTQTSEKAIINWQSLNVPAGGLLQFLQPNAGAIALNRVLGGTPSSILGNLVANGQVWIINPAGILFGRGASVNVGGLIATTSNISDQNFLNGNYAFDQPTGNAAAAVVNNGSINIAPGGAAILAGERVANNGLIEANLGRVTLAAGNEFTVDFTGDSLISFAITAPVSETPQGRNGTAAQALVANSGTLSAPGGEVLLTADAARTVLTNAINTTGMISATTAHEENGEIVLDAGPTGSASISGTLDASGKGAGQTGGTIAVTGGSVAVAANTVLDATGDAGGGTIAVGGDLHGAGPLADAATVTVAEGAVLNASAITNGNGGTVSVWSSGTTTFNGTILVEGGAQGGNGGLAETSGANLSVTSGTVDALAATGAAGTWLLDPLNITVATGGTASLTGVGNFGNDAGLSDTISPATIDSAAANVVLNATHDITFTNAVSMANAGIGITAVAGDSITVNAAITTKGGEISLTANSNAAGTATGTGSITVNAPLNALGSATSAGNISLTIAGTTSTGAVVMDYSGAGVAITGGAVSIATNAAVILPSISGRSLTVTAPGITQDGAVAVTGGLTLTSTGAITLADAANAFSGNIVVTALNADLVAADAIALGAISVTNNLTLSAPGILENGNITAGGTVTLAVGAGNSITLGSTKNSIGAIVLDDASVDNLTLANSAGSIVLPAITVTGNLALTAPGISESGAVTVDGNSVLNAGTSNVTLANAANSFGSLVYLTANDATIAASGPVAFGSVSVAGNLSVTSAGVNGNLPVTVGGMLDLDVATGGSINLSYAGNAFSGGIELGSGVLDNFELIATTPITVPGVTTTGNFVIRAPGIAQTGAIVVGGLSGMNAGTSTITLTNAGNSFAGDVYLTASSATLTAANAISFGGANVSGAMTVTAPGISQDNPINVGGTLTLAAGPGNSITLDQANDFGGSVVVNGGAADVTLVNTVALALSPLDIAGALSVTAPEITLAGAYTTGAGQSYNGPVTLGGTVTLSDSSLGGIVFANAVSGAGDALTITSGPVTFDAGATLGTRSTQAATLNGTMAAAGPQTYGGPVTLAGDVTVSGTGVGEEDNYVDFLGTVSGSGYSLTVTRPFAYFGGSVELGTLSVQQAELAANITSNAGQTYGGQVTLDNDVTLVAGGTVTFGNGVVNGIGTSALTVNAPSTVFDPSSSQLGALSVGAATLSGTIMTSAGQTYSGPVTLSGDTTLADTGSTGVVFESAVTGPGKSLYISDGPVSFAGPVLAGSLFLQPADPELEIDPGPGGDIITLGGFAGSISTGVVAATLGGNVTTTGGQTYGGPVTLAASVTLSDPTSIAFESTVTGAAQTLTVANGTVAFQAGATLGALSTQGASLDGTIATTGSQNYAGPIALAGNVTLAASGGSSAISFSGNSALDTGDALAVLAGGNVNVAGTIENAGTGALTVVAGWNGVTAASLAPTTAGAFGLGGATLTIGGATASGNAALGSAGGMTTVAAGNLTLLGQNGFAQIGFDGGGATGAIAVSLTGNLAMTGGGTGDYVQIGHGGLGSSGSEGGAISVAAAGTIALDGGSGAEAYAQIGHGGASSNEGTTVAFSDTGDISVAGLSVTLAAGAGDGAYVQIGHGGLNAGSSATLSSGSIVISGNIAVTSAEPLTMTGDGLSAYAQIGNGGYGADGHATLADGGAITESGDIDVTTGTAASSGAVDLVGDAYAQIGNGGYAINEGASAAGGIDESGAISVDVVGGSGRLVGGDTGAWAYAQIGNGDASGTGAGNVSGAISLSLTSPMQLVDGTAATAWMWNATGHGTVSGTTSVDGAIIFPPGEAPVTPPPPTFDLSGVPGLDSIDASDGSAPPVLTNTNPTPVSTSVAFNGGVTNLQNNTGDDLAASLNAIVPEAGGSSSGAGPLELMTDGSRSGGDDTSSAGAAQEGDELSSEVALSLTGKASATQTTSCIRTGTGETILCQLAPEPGVGKTPVGVQPADQPYSSWGNDSLWQE